MLFFKVLLNHSSKRQLLVLHCRPHTEPTQGAHQLASQNLRHIETARDAGTHHSEACNFPDLDSAEMKENLKLFFSFKLGYSYTVWCLAPSLAPENFNVQVRSIYVKTM